MEFKLTVINRLKLCWEILTVRSGHSHPAQEKQLSTFQRGYCAGMRDMKFMADSDACEWNSPGRDKATDFI